MSKVEKATLKIGDFGLIKLLRSKGSVTGSQVGTPLYISPEILNGSTQDTSSDIFSLGMIILQMVLNMKHKQEVSSPTAIDPLTVMETFKKELLNPYMNQSIRIKLYQQFNKVINPKLATLIYECLDIEPEQRPTASEIVQFINGSKFYIRKDPSSPKPQTMERTISTPVSPFTDVNVALENPTIENKEANAFWKKHFGESIEIKWRTFCGAYQASFGRLGVVASRGLKKLLCMY